MRGKIRQARRRSHVCERENGRRGGEAASAKEKNMAAGAKAALIQEKRDRGLFDTGTIADGTNECCGINTGLGFVSSFDAIRVFGGLVGFDEVNADTSETAAGQTSPKTTGDGMGKLDDPVEFGAGVFKVDARAFVALEEEFAEAFNIVF